MQIFSSKKRVAAIGAVTALTLVGGGMAVAYWTTSGSDTSTASVGTDTGFTVTIGALSGGALSPGGATNTFDVTVENPGPGVLRLNQLVVSVAGTEDTGGNPITGCTASDFEVGGTVGSKTYLITPEDLAPGTGSHTFTDVTLQMIDTGSPQDACKEATVNLEAVAS